MKMIAYRDRDCPTTIMLEAVRSNYRNKLGEVDVEWIAYEWGVGDSCRLEQAWAKNDQDYQRLLSEVPNRSDDIDRIMAEADALALSLQDAIRGVALRLRKNGIPDKGVETMIKERILEQLASRRLKERLCVPN